MAVEVKIPEVGESIREVQIAQWLKQEGDWVEKDEEVVEIDTDKATLQVPAPAAGRLSKILKQVGDMVEVGDSVAQLEEGDKTSQKGTKESKPEAEVAEAGSSKGGKKSSQGRAAAEQGNGAQEIAVAEEPPKQSAKAREKDKKRPEETADDKHIMPAARRALAEHGLNADEVEATGPGGRLLKEDVLRHVEQRSDRHKTDQHAAGKTAESEPTTAAARDEEIVPMTMIRRRIAQRLVEAQQKAALLTTFNEIDMSAVMELRKRHKEEFEQEYGIKLGFMSFFVKAAIEALKRFPAVNAEVRDTNLIYRNYYDIGIAIGGGKGLVVPVLRNAERMSFADIERTIDELARRARDNRLKPEELQGGTFTISNGGIYGSLLSTPIVNPPQSGVLGLHAIQERPVAREGQVVIRPMMYVALTYDHRIIDGREAVTFLRHMKEVIEEPSRMLIEV